MNAYNDLISRYLHLVAGRHIQAVTHHKSESSLKPTLGTRARNRERGWAIPFKQPIDWFSSWSYSPQEDQIYWYGAIEFNITGQSVNEQSSRDISLENANPGDLDDVLDTLFELDRSAASKYPLSLVDGNAMCVTQPKIDIVHNCNYQ